MKIFCIVLLAICLPFTVLAKAKRSFTINEFNMELDSLAGKYGKIAIDKELREREKKLNEFRENNQKMDPRAVEKNQAIQTSIDRHSYIGKEVEIVNLYFSSKESKTLIFRDDTVEGRVTVYYKSSQKSQIKNQIMKYPGQKLAVTGTFIRVGKEGIELNFVSAKVIH